MQCAVYIVFCDMCRFGFTCDVRNPLLSAWQPSVDGGKHAFLEQFLEQAVYLKHFVFCWTGGTQVLDYRAEKGSLSGYMMIVLTFFFCVN